MKLHPGRDTRLLVIGAGDIGRRVIDRLGSIEAKLAATSTPAKRGALRRLGATPILADLDRPGTLQRLPRDWNLLLHCAPPPSAGARDDRTRNLLAALRWPGAQRARSVARAIVYLSTSGVYGDCDGARVSEACRPRPRNARALRRLDAEGRLERFARHQGMGLIILRVPGIYAPDRLPLARLAAGTPAIVAAEDSFTNHIHAHDLAGIVLRALSILRRRRPRQRVFNASDDSEMRMGDYFDLVAHAYGLNPPPRLPRDAVRRVVSPLLWSFMSESRRLDNGRMKRELRVRLDYPQVAQGVAQAARSRAPASPAISLKA
ncbi:MAG: NAD-dependent epimerase/dehydratase family protein [Burkholderiales bacterium]|nr:NAD-dependent epimerase/dehydratase family protein [Burkholderiales bacterium]